MNYKKCAERIYNAIGGESNIINVTHCATRLRIRAADFNICDTDTIENTECVKGVFRIGSELHIVIGSDVMKVYEAFFSKDGSRAANYHTEKERNIKIYAPVSGETIELSMVNDIVFASGVLGRGIAIMPCENIIKSPMSGTVSTIPDTCHAVGLTLDNGAELLIHIGINTSELKGCGFKSYVKDGERVICGQKLIEFERGFIHEKGFDIVIPIIISNSDVYSDIKIIGSGHVNAGDIIMEALE